jgi:hypothetical protein
MYMMIPAVCTKRMVAYFAGCQNIKKFLTRVTSMKGIFMIGITIHTKMKPAEGAFSKF